MQDNEGIPVLTIKRGKNGYYVAPHPSVLVRYDGEGEMPELSPENAVLQFVPVLPGIEFSFPPYFTVIVEDVDGVSYQIRSKEDLTIDCIHLLGDQNQTPVEEIELFAINGLFVISSGFFQPPETKKVIH